MKFINSEKTINLTNAKVIDYSFYKINQGKSNTTKGDWFVPYGKFLISLSELSKKNLSDFNEMIRFYDKGYITVNCMFNIGDEYKFNVKSISKISDGIFKFEIIPDEKYSKGFFKNCF